MPSPFPTVRQALAIVLFALQLCWIATQFPRELQFYTWAALQSFTSYRIRAKVGETVLTPAQACQRYRLLEPCGLDHLTAYHVFDAITQYEATYGKNDHAAVSVDYQINGKEYRVWTLP